MSVVVPGELELLRASVTQELCLVANPPPWRQLVPFAYWLIDALRPKTFVELGTHTGVSYSAFCRAVHLTGTACSCFAVDTWLGDEHAGFFSSDVYETLSALHSVHFSEFSSLIRSTFDEASSHFGEKSIDLLHIDGRHDYESVRHDFYTWLPKVTDRGVVLFHDINVRERNFGVWKFWEEISQKYPSFAFLHSNGLGVLAVGDQVPERIKWLTGHAGDGDFDVQVRAFFSQIGLQHEAILERPILKSEVRDVRLQLASEAAKNLEACDEWQGRAQQAQALLDEAIAEVETFKRFYAETTAQNDRLQATLGEVHRGAQHWQQEAQRLEGGIEEVQRGAQHWQQHAQRLEEVVKAMRDSTSWLLTAPLRRGVARIGLTNWQHLSRFSRRVGRVLLRRVRLLRSVSNEIVASPIVDFDSSLVASSGLFDDSWYRVQYSEAGGPISGEFPLDAIKHYLKYGAARGYNPNPIFDTNYYLTNNRDVADAGLNPLVHYITSGEQQGRWPAPLFDPAYYLNQYSDVKAKDMGALAHYLQYGSRDGLATSPASLGTSLVATRGVEVVAASALFDEAWYYANYGDVSAEGRPTSRLDAIEHYFTVGAARGNKPNSVFDSKYYLEMNQDVAEAGLNPLVHYITSGAAQGRRPAPFFDHVYYLNRYSDVPTQIVDALAHYLEHGIREGRSTNAVGFPASMSASPFAELVASSDLFDEAWYCTNYSDVSALKSEVTRLDAIEHYLTVGAARGYNPNQVFDTNYYLSLYQDVAATGVNPLVHYLLSGAIEQRRPNLFFDPKYYLAQHSGIKVQGHKALAHYLHQGVYEGRSANADGFQIHSRDRNPKSERVAAERLEKMDYKPIITIVTPVYNVDPVFLRLAVESVRGQLYSNWELCLCDDGSTSETTLACLKSLEDIDPRIRVKFQSVNQGISAASNIAVSMGRGDFVAMLDHDDELTSDALSEIVWLLNQQRDLDVIYSDQDKIDTKGWVCDRFFKPQWSPEFFRGVMYVGHLLVVRRELLERVGGFCSQFDKVQDFELMLRVSEHTSRIAHIPRILYHWRKVSGSVALGSDEKTDIEELQVKAVAAHLARLEIAAAVEPQTVYRHRVRSMPLSDQIYPQVSIVIPTRDAPEHISRCLHSVFTETRYPNFEVVLVDNGTTNREALAAIAKYDLVRVAYDKPFNFSEANNLGVAAANGEIVVLLNNDTEIVDPGWLETMVFFLNRPDVGAVGAKLLYPNRTIQHAGVVLGMRGTADHVMRGFPEHADGYAGSLSCTREVSAVTGACLMVRKSDYIEVGGLVTYYRTHYQDVDFCLRLQQRGLRIIFTPDATLIHHESASRGGTYDFVDRALFIDQWEENIAAGDRYFNPNFCIEKGDYSLSYKRWAS